MISATNSAEQDFDTISAAQLDHERLLVETYRTQLVRMLTNLTRDPDRAEDFAHETLMVVISKLRQGGIDKPERISSYIYSTARYIFYGWTRKMDNKVELRNSLEDLISREPGIDAELVREKEIAAVHSSINAMPVARDREILTRYYVEDQTKPEICAALLLTAEHYDRVISRARKRFSKIASECQVLSHQTSS